MLAGGCDATNWPEDMVLRDTFCYVAENRRFQVVNVARPREPVLVGSCVVGDATGPGMCLRDTLAYVTNLPTQVVNVADPGNPAVVGEFQRAAWNVFVEDTFAYLTVGSPGIIVYSIGNPSAPYPVDSLAFGPQAFDVVMEDTLAYVGCGNAVRLLSVADPLNLRELGLHVVPNYARRLFYSPPYLYVACAEAGVCIFETTQVGIAESNTSTRSRLRTRALPSPTTGTVRLEFGTRSGRATAVVIRDVLGRETGRVPLGGRAVRSANVNLKGLRAGLYLMEIVSEEGVEVLKLVKN
jgi:hypothetical protein